MPVRQRDDLITEIGNDLQEHIIEIRQRRRWVEEQWLRGNRAHAGHGHENRFQSSDSSPAKYNIPFVRKAIERTVVRAVKMLMPNSKRYEIQAVGEVSDSKLANVDQYMAYILSKKIKTKTNLSQLVRCLVLYNRCHLKTSITVKDGQVWPTQRVVDPFSFYMYPETAVNVDEADFLFEDFLLSYERYQGFVDKGIVKKLEVSALTAPTWPYHLTERLSYQGLSDSGQHGIPTTEDKKGVLTKMPTPFVSLSEVWLQREDRLHQAYIVWNCDKPQIVSFFPSEYDEPCYRSAVHRSLPNEAYGPSMMDDVVELEGLCNDQLNKFQDAVDWEQGIVFANAGRRRDSWKVKGRAVWEMEDAKEDATFIQTPSTSPNQLRAFQIILGLVNAMGATGTMAEGQPGRNMPRAGGAVQSLISLALADTQDLSELIEQEVITPGLSDIYRVSMQFIPDDQLIRIPGGVALQRKSAVLKKEDFTGDYEFEWVGSLQFQDDQQRAQRMMIFMNMLPQLAPMLQQVGYGFNAVELIQNIWRYSLGERSLQKIILPLDELQKNISAEQAERMMAEQLSGTQNGNGRQNGQPSPGMGGLKYNLPSATDGFVQQGG